MPRIYDNQTHVHNQGRVTLASATIRPGVDIISEEPLLSVIVSPQEMVDWTRYLQINQPCNGSESIAAIVERMSKSKRRDFRALHNVNPAGGDVSIVKSNSFTDVTTLANGEKVSISRVYKNISRVNHSCVPNAAVYWNENRKHGTLYALQRINQGEEILIDYRPKEEDCLRQGLDRRNDLQLDYGFNCRCAACELPGQPGQPNINDDVLRAQALIHHNQIHFVVELDDQTLRTGDQTYEVTRRAQINHLNNYIAALKRLDVRDGKIADAYLCRAEYFYQGFKRNLLNHATFQGNRGNRAATAGWLINKASDDCGRARDAAVCCQGNDHPEAKEAWEFFEEVANLAVQYKT